jgi:hypothetical protein
MLSREIIVAPQFGKGRCQMYHKRRRAGFKRLQREFRIRCPLIERFQLLSSSGGAKRRPPVCLRGAELPAFPTFDSENGSSEERSPSRQAMFDRVSCCNEEEDLPVLRQLALASFILLTIAGGRRPKIPIEEGR